MKPRTWAAITLMLALLAAAPVRAQIYKSQGTGGRIEYAQQALQRHRIPDDVHRCAGGGAEQSGTPGPLRSGQGAAARTA